MLLTCFYCDQPVQASCGFCTLVAVCDDHLDIHRPDQTNCLPFTIRRSEEKGNILVATRDIKPFEIILKDKPAIVGPFDDSSRKCLECFRDMSSIYGCSLCNLPLCGPGCEGGPRHREECSFLRQARPQYKEEDINTVYSAVAPIRMLGVKREEPRTWSRVDRLMDHLEERRKGEPWRFVTENVLPFLEANCSPAYQLDSEVVERIIGIFRTNSVKWEADVEGVWLPVGHAVCPIFSLLCHSCISNTRYTQTDTALVVRACVPIKEGQEITTQYRGPNDGNIIRRQDFPKYWMFTCSCIRCEDPTELGTMLSCVKCSQCHVDQMLPRSSAMESEWECRSCGSTREHADILQLTLRLERLVEGQSYLESPESWELLLRTLEEEVHPNHYLCMKVKRILLQLYGSREGYRLENLSRSQLERKLELCRNYCKIFSILEPGYRIWRGRVLEEMLGPLTMVLKLKQDEGQLGKAELFTSYRELLTMMKDAAKCRQFQEREGGESRIAEFYQTWTRPIQALIDLS